MTTKIPVELSSTPGIVDSSNATAITISSAEKVTFAKDIEIQGDSVSGSEGGHITLRAASGGSKEFGIDVDSSNRLRIITEDDGTGNNGVAHVYATNTGNVGIGIAPENAYTSYTALEISRSGSIYANNSADDLNIGTNFYLDSSGNWKAKNTETATLMQYDNGAVNIYTAASTTADNNISWNHKISFPNLGGIAFNGDTAAANSLDDYEEGTWSPQLVGSSGSAGTYAQSATTAVYTKIGNRVFFNCTFYVTNKGSYSGVSVITGLPFTNNGSTTAVSTGSFPDSGYGTTSGNVLIVGQVESGGTRIIFYEGSRLDAQHAYADVGTGYYVNVAGNYMTNS